MKIQDVSVSPIVDNFGGDLADKFVFTCSYCEKRTPLPNVSRQWAEKLSKPDNFYCHFCLRNGLYTRNNRHTLILTYRSIIGYYYYAFYRKPQKKVMWVSQIKDYVEMHMRAGLQNPIFKYDPESMLWFIDFTKVGNGKRQLPLEEVYKTVASTLASFNLYETCPTIRMHKMYEKYREAIETFYKQRSRPVDKKILNPTLLGVGLADNKDCPFDKPKEFTWRDMVP